MKAASSPFEIDRTRLMISNIKSDIVVRDCNHTDAFEMQIGNRTYSGKGAREEAAKMLTYAVHSWRGDETRQIRAHFRGFGILSQGKRPTFIEAEPLPALFVRGNGLF